MSEPALKLGAQGSAVHDLQEALTALGYHPGPADGHFGATTQNAVKAFQAAVGLSPDGIVGPITWRNIDEADQSEPVLRRGSHGLPVRRLQYRMQAFGYPLPNVDGRFGPWTESAVRDLQADRGLTVDGIVGRLTWAVVDALENEGPYVS
jgi:peptidoglycan hydrolase-like protein with peptidoglycan-binding domain